MTPKTLNPQNLQLQQVSPLELLCPQVAPKEVLTTKGGLSPATARLLSQPPVPLQLSYVDAGSEFPDASSSLEALSKQVSYPAKKLCKTILYKILIVCLFRTAWKALHNFS